MPLNIAVDAQGMRHLQCVLSRAIRGAIEKKVHRDFRFWPSISLKPCECGDLDDSSWRRVSRRKIFSSLICCVFLMLLPLLDQSASARSALPGADFVRPEDFRTQSETDDTLSLERAAKTNKKVLLKSGKTYIISRCVEASTVVGEGRGATLVTSQKFAGVGCFFQNPHRRGPDIIDHDILYENLTVDAGAMPVEANSAFHAFQAIFARRVRMSKLTCHNVGDCTAMVSSIDTTVVDCYADGVTNVAFDHWGGPVDALVQDSVAVCSGLDGGRAGDGIMFTGATTDYKGRRAERVVSRRNQIYGHCLVAIDFNQLSKDSSTVGARSEDDFFDARGSRNSLGIRFTGRISKITLVRPVLANQGAPSLDAPSGNSAISFSDDGLSGVPDTYRIEGAKIFNWATAPSNYAPIALGGSGGSFVDGLQSDGPKFSFFSVYATSPDTEVSGHLAPGRNGLFSTAGAIPRLSSVKTD